MPKGKPITIDFNKIYSSKFDGDFIILKETERDQYNNRQVLIKWLNTNNLQIVSLSNAIKCSVRDKLKNMIDYSKIYSSNNFGDFKIINKVGSINNHIMVNIQFINTGTITTVRLSDAKSGNVRDRYAKTVAGVGCIGNASSYNIAYSVWESMIQRCYNKNLNIYKRYGAKGVTVCDKWKCFEYFLQDLPFIDGYNKWLQNPNIYQLDKDKKQMNVPYDKKIYSLETCCFIQVSDNVFISRYESNIRNNSECKFVGVRKICEDKYQAYININGYMNLGTYETEEIAAAAYNNAANLYYNNRAILNNVDYIDSETLELLRIKNL